jgi:hypothetical protein
MVPSFALSLKEAAKPAEFPAADYTGQSYTDSRGCIYLRAGRKGAPVWLPRITRDRKVMCTPPPQGANTATTLQKNTPKVAAAPKTLSSKDLALSGPVTRTVRVKCPEKTGVFKARLASGEVLPVRCEANRTEPLDYIVDHDNGERTRVIAIPLELEKTAKALTKTEPKTLTKTVPKAPVTTVKPNPTGRYVQVGGYGNPSNAKAVEAKLSSMGYGTSSKTSLYKGKQVRTIFAGPFGGDDALQKALNMLRDNGFSDAFVKR